MLANLRNKLSPKRWLEKYVQFRRQFAYDACEIGTIAAGRLAFSRWRWRQLCQVDLPGYEVGMYFRPRTSDADVIRQVFVAREYEALKGLSNVRLIVDCGANIGCTAFYLLCIFPQARIVVIEPDAGNMAICRRNLQPFGQRVTFIQAGVWSDSSPLRVVRGAFRDGRAWSFQVKPCSDGEKSDFGGLSMLELVRQFGDVPVDLLKIDIEGAEEQVFGAGDLAWLSQVRNIAIELHDERCRAAFNNALCNYSYVRRRSGELTICEKLCSMSAPLPDKVSPAEQSPISVRA